MIDRMRAQTSAWDLVVIGGGATGLGAALDAATRGWNVALIERDDFAQGTSSRSTKLVHGGLRYLRQGNFRLVREALAERQRLMRNAPDLVHPVDFVLPVYKRWESPYYALGIGLYQKFAGETSPAAWSRAQLHELCPMLRESGEMGQLRRGLRYRDAQFDDAGLALALATTAARHEAVLANYVEATGLIHDAGRVAGVEAVDRETGEPLRLRARVVLNATGVFCDTIRRMDEPTAPALLRPSQGAHLVLPRDFWPGETALIIPKTDDGRVLFAIPWQGVVVLGTTDVEVRTIEREPHATRPEVDYLLELAGRYLVRPPERSDVLSVFAGLRPLVASGEGSSTAGLARDHTLRVSRAGLLTVTGGKWTTYRQMAQEAVDRAAQIGGIDAGDCRTADLPITGDDAQELRAEIAADQPALSATVHERLALTGVDVVAAVHAGMARTVGDVLARRTRSLLLDARATREAAPAVAQIMARELRWSMAELDSQLTRFDELARGYILEA